MGEIQLFLGVKLSLSFGGKQVKKERSEESILHQYSGSFLLDQQIEMEKQTVRCRSLSSDLKQELQIQKVSAPFLGQKKDLLLQDFPVFPGCGRHHLSLQMVLSVHTPSPSPSHGCCYSKAPQLSPLWLNWAAMALLTSGPGHLLQWVLAEDWGQMHWCSHEKGNNSLCGSSFNLSISKGVQFSATLWSCFLQTSGL